MRKLESDTTGNPDFDLPYPLTESRTNPKIGCAVISKFEIGTGTRNSVRISAVNDDPDGLPSYDTAFVFSIHRDHPIDGQTAYQRVTVRQAWQIARFLTRHMLRAKVRRTFGNIRRTAGCGSRPREP
jgi:hypothetical protein